MGRTSTLWCRRSLPLIMLIASAVLGGAAVLPEFTEFSALVASSVLGYSVLWWCVLDARLRQSPIPHGVVLIMLGTWPLATVVYLFWTRRFLGLGLAFISFIALMFAMIAGGMLTEQFLT